MDTKITTPDGTVVVLSYSLADACKRVRAHHRITASVEGRGEVGFLTWNDRLPRKTAGMILDIQVSDRELHRQGVATAMYAAAKGTGFPICHSDSRTMAGDRWADSTGDPVPPLRERVTGYVAGRIMSSDRPVRRVRVVDLFAPSARREEDGSVLVDSSGLVFRLSADTAVELGEWLASQGKS